MRISDLRSDVCSSDLYAVTMDDDVILFRNRSGLKSKPDPVASAGDDAPYIDPETMHDAKTAEPGYDVYALYDEWVSWWHDMAKPELKSTAGALLGFWKTRHARTPLERKSAVQVKK